MGRQFFDRSTRAGRSRTRHRSTRAVAAAGVVAGLVAAVVGCGDENGVATSGPTTTVASTSTTEPTVTGLEAGGMSPVSTPPPEGAGEAARLVGVRVTSQEGYDRVVFELEGDLPGYDVGYLEGGLYEEGSGEELAVGSSTVLSVRMTPASGVVLRDDGIEQVYNGERRIPGDGDPVIEVVSAGDFEAQITWGIVVDDQRPFQVSRLEAPNRLVVDVASA